MIISQSTNRYMCARPTMTMPMTMTMTMTMPMTMTMTMPMTMTMTMPMPIPVRHLNFPIIHYRRQQRVNAGLLESVDGFATTMHIAAKGIILFTLFYSSMNWWYYKRTREDYEKEQKEHKDKQEERRKNTKDIF
jgi:hypothetical protein